MDEAYENRPEAKHSLSTAAKKAGVRSSGGKDESDEETAAFLESVMHKSGTTSETRPGSLDENSARAQAREENDSQISLPSPPPLHSQSSESEDVNESTTSVIDSSEYTLNNANADVTTLDVNDNMNYSTNANTQQMIESADAVGGSSSATNDFRNGSNNSNQQQTGIVGTENGDIPSQIVSANSSQLQQQLLSGNTVNPYETKGVIDNTQIATSETSQPNASSSVTQNQQMANEAMSGEAFLSNSISAQSADQVKAVYKDSFYRWNHPFRSQPTVESGGEKDVPVFWRIPRSASSTLEGVLSYCYGMTLASALGVSGGHANDEVSSCSCVVYHCLENRYCNSDVLVCCCYCSSDHWCNEGRGWCSIHERGRNQSCGYTKGKSYGSWFLRLGRRN